MKKNFNELKNSMDASRIASAEARARDMMVEMLLSEMRKLSGKTQEELAAALGIKQPTLSRLESQTDIQVSTLQRLIEALGGRLELIAHLPSGDVRITQFGSKAG